MQALVVDDSAAVRAQLCEVLTQLGFQVEQACDGTEALKKAPALAELAVVMLDWTMPDMNGLEVLRQLRAGGSVAAVPVVMVTTEGELPFVDDAFNAGANEYLMKPFDGPSVLEKLLLLGIDPELRRAA